MIVGLTGGIGSGKSSAMSIFQQLGVGCVDADIVAREVVEPGQPALESIKSHFGQGILTTGGLLNRTALREIIFKNPEEKHWLEQLLHPLIRKELLSQLASQHSAYAVLVAPLLFENGLDQQCDTTVLIDVPETTQVERILARDGGTEDQAKAIIRSQMARAEKLARADHVIANTGSLKELDAKLVALHHQLMAQTTL